MGASLLPLSSAGPGLMRQGTRVHLFSTPPSSPFPPPQMRSLFGMSSKRLPTVPSRFLKQIQHSRCGMQSTALAREDSTYGRGFGGDNDGDGPAGRRAMRDIPGKTVDKKGGFYESKREGSSAEGGGGKAGGGGKSPPSSGSSKPGKPKPASGW